MNKRHFIATLGSAALGLAPAVHANTAAPDFTLRSADGRNLRLAEQRGQIVLINFWATWCGPCKIEMPHLQRLHERYRGSGFTLLAVSVDEDPAQAAAMAQKMGLRFPVLFDADKQVTRRYDVATLPSTMLVDRDGRLRHTHRGYREGDEKTYEQWLRELLKDA